MSKKIAFLLIFSVLTAQAFEEWPSSPIRINQIGYEPNGPKTAVFEWVDNSVDPKKFEILDDKGEVVHDGDITSAGTVDDWNVSVSRYFWTMDFSDFRKEGKFNIKVDVADTISFEFEIRKNVLFTETVGGLISCFKEMRNTMKEDENVRLVNSNTKINLYGGYNEASGDDSKHITHLQWTNYMCNQEIPMVPWVLLRAYELDSAIFDSLKLKGKLLEEIAWGVDYLMTALSEEGFFYSTVFNGWEDPNWPGRIACAYTVLDFGAPVFDTTTSTYETAFREGGGLSIAALAKASYMGISGRNSSEDYLEGAEKAYENIKNKNLEYCDDGEEHINDDYSALMAAIELFRATDNEDYKKDASERAKNLIDRLTSEGWFASDDAENRPYWSAAEEGLPLIALIYYMEIDNSQDDKILEVLGKSVDWYLKITNEVTNPFNYIRMYCKPYENGSLGEARKSFFIPQKNESGYWWQGENARLGSMAAAMLLAAKTLDPEYEFGSDSITSLAISQLDWILGKNPFETCMLFGYGTVNHDDYIPRNKNTGRGSIVGGICNGITSGDGYEPEIEFGPYDDWHNWRWLEQWLPHESWYMFAISTLSNIIRGEQTAIKNHSNNNKKPASLSVVRNLLNGRVIINIEGNNYKNLSLNLYDLKGRIIKSFEISNTTKSIDLNMKRISTGLYFLELKAGKTGLLRKKVYSLK